MGFQEEGGILLVLYKAEKPLPEIVGSLVLRPHEVKSPQPPQDRKEFRALPDLLG